MICDVYARDWIFSIGWWLRTGHFSLIRPGSASSCWQTPKRQTTAGTTTADSAPGDAAAPAKDVILIEAKEPKHQLRPFAPLRVTLLRPPDRLTA